MHPADKTRHVALNTANQNHRQRWLKTFPVAIVMPAPEGIRTQSEGLGFRGERSSKGNRLCTPKAKAQEVD